MSIQLVSGATTIQLHEDLWWSDESGWHPVEQTVERTVTGALVIESAQRLAGREITLEPEDDSSAWMSGATLTALRNLAAVPGLVMQLTIRGQAYDVVFRHHAGSPIDAKPVVYFRDASPGDWHRVTLKFMTV